MTGHIGIHLMPALGHPFGFRSEHMHAHHSGRAVTNPSSSSWSDSMSQGAVDDRKMGDHLSTKEELAVGMTGQRKACPAKGHGAHASEIEGRTMTASSAMSFAGSQRWRCLHTNKPWPLQIKVRELQEENERLRRDNERFVRLIDSGEWGRGRVAELVRGGWWWLGEGVAWHTSELWRHQLGTFHFVLS